MQGLTLSFQALHCKEGFMLDSFNASETWRETFFFFFCLSSFGILPQSDKWHLRKFHWSDLDVPPWNAFWKDHKPQGPLKRGETLYELSKSVYSAEAEKKRKYLRFSPTKKTTTKYLFLPQRGTARNNTIINCVDM